MKFFVIVTAVVALRFNIAAKPKEPLVRCFEQYVTEDTPISGYVDAPSTNSLKIDFMVF